MSAWPAVVHHGHSLARERHIRDIERHQFAAPEGPRKNHQQEGAVADAQQPGREPGEHGEHVGGQRGGLAGLGGALGAADAGDQGAHGGAAGGRLVAGELVRLADGAAALRPPTISREKVCFVL